MIIPTANRYPCGDGKWVVLNMPEEKVAEAVQSNRARRFSVR